MTSPCWRCTETCMQGTPPTMNSRKGDIFINGVWDRTCKRYETITFIIYYRLYYVYIYLSRVFFSPKYKLQHIKKKKSTLHRLLMWACIVFVQESQSQETLHHILVSWWLIHSRLNAWCILKSFPSLISGVCTILYWIEDTLILYKWQCLNSIQIWI